MKKGTVSREKNRRDSGGAICIPWVFFFLLLFSLGGCFSDQGRDDTSQGGTNTGLQSSSTVVSRDVTSAGVTRVATSAVAPNAKLFPGKGAFPGKGKSPFQDPNTGTPPDLPEATELTFPTPGVGFISPLRIDSTAKGWLLVSDSRLRALVRVDPQTLKADQTLYLKGKPLGVGVLGLEIFVGMAEQKSIEILNLRGEHKGYLAPPGQAGNPTDLGIDAPAGLVFALDGVARVVRVYQGSTRSLVGTLGAGALTAPSAVSVDTARKEVLVSDYGSSSLAASVVIFSYAPATFGDPVDRKSVV